MTTAGRRPTLESVKVRVLDLLDAAGKPMTTWEVWRGLGAETMSDDPVHRALKALVASGEVRREKAGHAAARFWTEREEG
jgi:Fe2+ or Zn2+ uptake regulation protein